MTIKYNDNEINVKYGFKAFLIYENITGKSFNPTGLQDIVYFFYACVCAGQKGDFIPFDDFMDFLDEHIEVFQEFSDYIQQQTAKQHTLAPVVEEKEDGAKKKK